MSGSVGYVRLKSVYSGLYVGVDSANTAQIIQTATQDDYTLWQVARTYTGHMKLTCKATNDVLAVPLNANSNGTNLTQLDYTGDTNYRDEWELYSLTRYLNNQGAISYWNSDSNRIGYWEDPVNICTKKHADDSEFYFSESYNSAMSQWEDALNITFSTVDENDANVTIHGLTAAQYQGLTGKTWTAGITGLSTYVYYIHYDYAIFGNDLIEITEHFTVILTLFTLTILLHKIA